MNGFAARLSGLLALALLIAIPSFAMTEPSNGSLRPPITESTDLTFVPISAGPEMSQAWVGQIVDDNLGFIWFATRDRLLRYDGYQARPYYPRSDGVRPFDKFEQCCSTVSINPGTSRYSLFKDGSGKIWIGGDESLYQYDSVTDQIRSLRFPPGELQGFVRNVYRDRQGMLWLTTSHGLVCFDEATGRTENFVHRDGDAETLSSNQVRSTLETRDGAFWVATNSSLDLLDRSTGHVSKHFPFRNPMQPASTIGNPGIRLLEDQFGAIWIASARDGLAFLKPGQAALTFVALGSGHEPELGAWALLEDRNGALWIGTEAGLLKLDRDRQRLTRYRNNPADATTLPSDWVLSLYEDGEDGIWVGTANGGAARVSDQPVPFRRYAGSRLGEDTAQNHIFTAYESSDGSVWAGGRGILYQIDLQTGRYRKKSIQEDTEVAAITEDREGELWFAMLDGSLYRLNPVSGKITIYKHGARTSQGCGNNEVQALFLDHRGQLWIGAGDTLCTYTALTDQFTAYRAAPPGLNGIVTIAETDDGELWVGSSHYGVYRFDPATGKFTAFRHSDAAGSLSSDAVAAVLVDHSGALWVGTAEGLSRLNKETNTFTCYREGDGLPSDRVNGIVEDASGSLWITTSYGLAHLNPQTGAFHNYYKAEGWFDDLTGAWQGRSGQILLGSYSGLTVLSASAAVRERSFEPRVVFTDFRIADQSAPVGADALLKQSISVTKALTVSHNQNTLSFEFAALTFSGTENLRYRYRLRELERDWRETQGGEHSVRYSTLSPGRYTFEVQVRTNSGNWAKDGAAVSVTILPPLWATWQFRTAVAFLLTWLLWQAHNYRLRRYSRQINIRFDERLAERSRIAQDLHDTLLQSVVSASMQLHVAAKGVPDELPAKARIDHTLELMGRVVNEGRNTLRGLRSAEPESPDLKDAFSRAIREMPESGQVKFRVLVHGSPRHLHPVVADDVYRIGFEAIRNAFRHAGASAIDVSIEYGDGAFRLVVHDDGRGLNPDVLRFGREGHFGLPGMRERAEKVGGKLRILSRPGGGTDVELTISRGSAYELPKRRKPLGWFSRRDRTESEEPND